MKLISCTLVFGFMLVGYILQAPKGMNSYDSEGGDVNQKDVHPLHSYTEVPHYLQGNQFIETGYRVSLSSGQCIQR